MNIFASTAMFPGKAYAIAMNQIMGRGWQVGDVLLSKKAVQLCPQTRDVLDEEMADTLRNNYPDVAFRVHANCKMTSDLRQFDASTPWDLPWVNTYINQLKRVSMMLGAQVFSWHASGHSPSTLVKAIEHTKRLEDKLEMPVAIEGLYPGAHIGAVLTTQEEYETLAESGVCMAIDLSHLKICYTQGTFKDLSQIHYLVGSSNCIEVHLSHNDGLHDSHAAYPVGEAPFGWGYLPYCGKNAVIFSESRSI
jgi:hypothetical protein